MHGNGRRLLGPVRGSLAVNELPGHRDHVVRASPVGGREVFAQKARSSARPEEQPDAEADRKADRDVFDRERVPTLQPVG